MPSSLPESLSPEARALYASIGSYIGRGVGADRTFAILRDNGARIPRATVRRIAAEERAALGVRADLSRINPDNPIPARLAPVSSQLQYPGYVVRVATEIADRTTGYTARMYFTYRSLTLDTPNQILATAEDAIGGSGAAYGYDVIAASIVDVRSSPVAGGA